MENFCLGWGSEHPAKDVWNMIRYHTFKISGGRFLGAPLCMEPCPPLEILRTLEFSKYWLLHYPSAKEKRGVKT